MSTDEYMRKVKETQKIISVTRKDLRYREEQQKRGQTTYSIDSEIKGSFSQLDDSVSRIQQIFSNFKANPRTFGLSNKEVEKRQQQVNQLVSQRQNLQRRFDSYFEKKPKTDIFPQNPNRQKQDYSKMNSEQLYQNKLKRQEEHEEAIGELIGVVKNTKQGHKAIGKELSDQQGLLDDLEKGMDENTSGMGRVRKNMVKLLDESSNCCLITCIIIELVAIFCIIFLWH